MPAGVAARAVNPIDAFVYAKLAEQRLKPSPPADKRTLLRRVVSDLLPKIAGCIDDMAFIYSLQSKSAIHGPAMFMMNTGFLLNGFPSMGAWINCGLGSETEELPAFVVLPDPRGVPPGGPRNWGAGFLPAVFQGTSLTSAKGQAPIANLFPSDSSITAQSETESRKLLAALNAKHASDRGDDDTERAHRRV